MYVSCMYLNRSFLRFDISIFFFFNDTATTEIYTLSLHDALPIFTVSERTHEIGLRKALGATNRNILFQFFLEGVLITLVSGVIGMVLATGLMAALGTQQQGPTGFDPPKLVPMSAILAIGSLTAAGVAAGLYPARKAAMLQPVEALRQE